MIDRLHQLAHGLVGVAGTALVHGTLLALVAALLAATVLRRARPGVRAALWIVVLLKFLVPFGPGARFSLASLLDRSPAAPAVTQELVAVPRSAGPVAPRRAPAPSHPVELAVVATWLAAVAVLGARQIRRYRRARRDAAALPAAPRWLDDELTALGRQIGVRRAITARIAPVGTPYVIGAISPIVVVPAALLSDETRRRAAMAHELAHVRRADGIVRTLQLVAATLFFFWPVVRWINRRLDLAREQACDAYALAHGPLDAAGYARMLIAVARQRTPEPALALGGSQLAHRVGALTRPTRAGIGPVGATVIGGFALVGLTGAGRATASPRPESERVCIFTPQVAAEIMASYPEADIDGDGALTRDEVCDFQQALRRRYVDDTMVDVAMAPGARERLASGMSMSLLPGAYVDEASPLASDQLCCNCSAPSGQPAEFIPAIATCPRGVDHE